MSGTLLFFSILFYVIQSRSDRVTVFSFRIANMTCRDDISNEICWSLSEPQLVLPELGWATWAEPKIAKRSCSHRLDALSSWTLLMRQLIDGIASSAMAYILFWKWQHKPHHSFTSIHPLTLQINLNVNINVATHSTKLEGCWARTHMYRAEIMDMWLFSYDMWWNKYSHTCNHQIDRLSILGPEKVTRTHWHCKHSTVLYSAPPIPAGIQWNPAGSSHSSGIRLQ